MDTLIRKKFDTSRRNEYEVAVAHTVMPDEVAELAFKMLINWGMVTGGVNREDSAGRAISEFPGAEVCATRAFDTAEAAFKIAKERGHLIDLPSFKELSAYEQYDEQK